MKAQNVGFVAIIGLAVAAGFFSLNLYFQQRSAEDRLDIRVFPYAVGEWRGKDTTVTDEEYQILETRNLISREYTHPDGEKLHLFIIYSETNRAVFHPPEVCFIGSGIKILDKQRENIAGGQSNFAVNKLYTEKDDYRGIALYCYKAGNLYTDNFYLQQASLAWNQLLGRHKGGATIRVFTFLKEDEKSSLAILKSFLAQVATIVESLSAHS